MQYFDPKTNENYVPYVLETSIGVDRMFLATMSNALVEETLDNGSTRDVLRLPPSLAPVKCAIMPLKRNNEELVGKAKEIYNQLKFSFNCMYDDTGSIGKLYRRQDATGTPYCVTVDFDTLEKGVVTLRERDSMEQEIVPVEQLEGLIKDKVDMKHLFKKL